MDEMIAQCTQLMGQMSDMLGGNMMGGSVSGGGSVISAWVSPWYWLGWVFVLGLTAFLVAGFVWTIRLARRPGSNPGAPLAILQRRLA